MDNSLKPRPPSPPSIYTKMIVLAVTFIVALAITRLLGFQMTPSHYSFLRNGSNRLFGAVFIIIFIIAYMIVGCLTAILESKIDEYYKGKNKEE